jgi:orotidine-5'-phosphate decarboxylase
LFNVFLVGHLLIVALDTLRDQGFEDPLRKIVEEVSPHVSGFKIGLSLLLEKGLGVISKVKKFSEREVIADLKLADIGDIMIATLKLLASVGVDAIIAHGFIGVSDALDKLIAEAEKYDVNVILVVSMSHRGSEKYIDKHFEELLQDAVQLGVHGVVIPATKPHLITQARRVLGSEVYIYSPGVGVQGAKPGDALCAGADYEIIGRLITTSLKPSSVVKTVKNIQLERVRECRGSL